MNIDSVITVFEYIGTVSFAVSGALKAVSKKMDILGVVVVAVITAMGGGLIRDTVIGIFPQKVFTEPSGALISSLSGVVVFGIKYWSVRTGFHILHENKMIVYIADTVGLAAFTVIGVNAGINAGYSSNVFLLVFLGAVTGVGGGVLRDITLKEIPEVFVRHVYACASIFGAAVFVGIYDLFGLPAASAVISVVFTALIRAAAIIFKLNLPSIKDKKT